jgi:two-component system, chemotaxis family, response regulator Rcp1
MTNEGKIPDILLIEDNSGDVRLIQEALKEGQMRNRLNSVEDGVEALAYLRREGRYADASRPDIIVLDLNLPKMDGREVLVEIKSDDNLKSIPVIILTTSKADKDVLNSYNLHANCYITKPVDLEHFITIIRGIEDFWLSLVTLPPHPRSYNEPKTDNHPAN